jgi:hypothetical protein
MVVWIALCVLLLAVVAGAIGLVVIWRRGIARLPLVARPYAKVVRLATWCGVGPRSSQTPYEYERDLERLVPAAADRIRTITEAYVARMYGARDPEPGATEEITTLGVETRRLLLRTLATGKWRAWIAARLSGIAGTSTGPRA